jgi:hypothetical protein
MVCEAEKSLESPKSIILTQVGSPFPNNMKFSGLISLQTQNNSEQLERWSAYLCEMLFSWRYISALSNYFIIIAASFSVKCLRSRIKWKSSPPLQYSSTRKQTSFHSQISCSFIMCGWFYRQLMSPVRNTYKHFENIDFINECGVVLDFFLLNRFHCKKLFALTMLRQVNHTEASIGKFLFKVVLVFDVALIWVYEHGCVTAARLSTGATGDERCGTFHS